MRKPLLFACVAALLCSTPIYADWEYQDHQDKMTGMAIKTAVVRSDNSLSLKFPYAGENRAQLMVREDEKRGLQVFVIVDKGQIICTGQYSFCDINVRFDEKIPTKLAGGTHTESFLGTRADDHSSTTIFIDPAWSFAEFAKNAKRLLIELTFYQNGHQVLEFSTPSRSDGTPR